MDLDINDLWENKTPRMVFNDMIKESMKDMPYMSLNDYKKQLHEDAKDQLREDYPEMIQLLQLIRNVLIKSEISSNALKIVMSKEDDKPDHMYQLNRTIELSNNLTRLINGLYKEKQLYEEK